jgi:alpha-N-acetylglucosaminidase
MDTNPYAYDLFTEMAWRSEPVKLDAWTAAYVQRRYGAADQHAIAAWRVLLHTAYDLHFDPAIYRSESDDAQESLFDAQPSLAADRASQWSPNAMRYDARAFARALPQMLQVAPALRASETYQYDLVDIARQTLANASRALLPAIKAAYEARDRAHFQALTQRWLALMELEDRLLASNRYFLLGRWLAPVKTWAATPAERAGLEHDARALLTTWGNREASEQGQLQDYGNRDWAGLTRDYYRLRWQTYFQTLDTALRTGEPPRRIDWFAMGEAWNHGSQVYNDQPIGDAYQLATRVQEALAQ